MVILNMVGGGKNPYQPFHLNAISDLSATPGNGEATITWTDPGNLVVDSQTLATWTSTKLVRKVGSAPSSSSDGTLVVTETVANTYSVTGYTDTGLTNGTTYYYAAFAVADNGTEIISNVESATPAVPAPTTFDDSFTGTALDTSIWTATQYGNEGSLVVNNGLSISSGSTPSGSLLSNGYTISTNAIYTGNETKVTAEVTYTGYVTSGADGGSFTILGNECRDGTGVMDGVTGVIYTTRQGWGYSLSYFNGTQAVFDNSYTTFSNPTTIKLELDIANDTAKMYINGTLSRTKTGILYSGKNWSDYIGQPLLTISPRYGDNLTINISNIKLTTE